MLPDSHTTAAPPTDPKPTPADTAGRWGIALVILLLLSVGLHVGKAFFVPIVIALMLACMLWPAVHWLHRGGLPWAASASLVMAGLVLVMVVSVAAVSRTVPDLFEA